MKIAAVISLVFFISLTLPAQCPDRNFIWNRIIFLRSSEISVVKQLDELLAYQQQLDQCKYRKDSLRALLYQRLGFLYTTQQDYFTGIQFTLKSIALVNEEKNNPAIKPAESIKSYRNLFMMYDSLNLVTKKIAAADSCISLALRLNAGYEYAIDALEICTHWLYSTGDYYRCIKYADLGESFNAKIGASLTETEQATLQFLPWQINALISLKQTKEADRLLTERMRKIEHSEKLNLLAAYYGLYGSVLRNEGKAAEAITYYKKSFLFNQKISFNQGCAEALNNIGYTYSVFLNQQKKAIPYFFKALKFADANEALNVMDNIANAYVQTGNYDSAFVFFQKAFNQLHPGFSEADLLNNYNDALPVNMTEYINGLIIDKASACLKKYKTTGNKSSLKEALRICQITDRYFDKLKSLQDDIQSKLFWKADNRRLYESAVEACYESNNLEMAFYFFEKNRSVLLNDEIRQQQQMNKNDITKQAQLKKNILEIERDLKTASISGDKKIILQQQLFANNQELEIIVKKINNKPLSFTQPDLSAVLLSVKNIREKILFDNRSLLEIFNGDSSVYILTISKKNSSFVKLNKQWYDSLTTAYISFIANPDLLNHHYAQFINASNQLYKLIFDGSNLPPGGSLILSPDGKSFPFEAMSTNLNFNQPDYLLNRYAISYTYSARYLLNEFTGNKNERTSLFGMAPVNYKKEFGLASLAGSDISLQKIKTGFSDNAIYIFDKASRKTFLEKFPNYKILQLYTHATERSFNNDPVIFFADSALYLPDLIAEQKPVTQLVVLSACETANGKLYRGEGIFSFNRGFAALGIPAAVSNLWSVDNESTYRITELFYKYLSQGMATDIALQKAKLDFINTSDAKEKKLPYYWAAPILTGKVSIFKADKDRSPKAIIILVMFVIGISYFATRYFFKKNN